MTDVTKAVLERYRAKRSSREQAPAPAVNQRRAAFLRAAAVLHRFSPASLIPFEADIIQIEYQQLRVVISGRARVSYSHPAR